MSTPRCLLLATLALAAPACVPAAPTDDGPAWPGFRGPERSGVSGEEWSTAWPAEGPKALWKAQLGTGSSGVAVGRGLVFSMGSVEGKDTVYALKGDTGAVAWTHAYPCELFPSNHEGGPAATPALDGARLYTLGRGGQLFCFEASTGKILWSHDFVKEFAAKMPVYGLTGSPLVLGDRLVVTASGRGASTVAFDKATGAVLWKSGDDEAAYASPVPFPEGARDSVLVFNAAALVRLDAATGAERGRYPWVALAPNKAYVNAPTPVVAGDTVFITTGYNQGCARLRFPAGAGAPEALWKAKSPCAHYSGPVLYRGHLYGFDVNNEAHGKGKLSCVELETGVEKWARKDLGWGNVAIAGGRLLALTREGELAVVEALPAEYKELARAQVIAGPCRTEPTVFRGRLYVRNAKGELACFDVAPGR
jgi:outer membrane protein assembly factor BamB